MVSPQGVAVATLLILGVVHGNLLDDLKKKFGGSSFGGGGGGSSSFGSKFGLSSSLGSASDFDIPKLDASKASMVHSSNSHKGHHKSSGSSSNTHSLTVVGADGKNITQNDETKSGYDKESKVDEANEKTMIKSANGSVVETGKSHNKSSVDDNEYALEKHQHESADKLGNKISLNSNKVNNKTRAAALDEAKESYNLKNADGTFIRNETGHKNTDEHLSHHILDEDQQMALNADGTSHNTTHRKGSIGDSHKSDQHAFSNHESMDAQGNNVSIASEKLASSDKGSSSDFEENAEALKNADGTSSSNVTGNFNNTNYDKAMQQEVMQKKLVNADGTSSLEGSHAGSNSSKINSSSGSHSALDIIGKNGTYVHQANNKTDDYKLDEANQSAGSISEQIGKNGVRSHNESSIESGRKAESRNNTASSVVDTMDEKGARTQINDKSASGTSLDENHNLTHALQASVDEHGNVRNHSVAGGYRNKKTGAFDNSEKLASIHNADGTESIEKMKTNNSRNGYEAEKFAEENTNEKNADGTVFVESKGSNSKVNRTDGFSNMVGSNYQKGLNGMMSNETTDIGNSYNSSDAESNQFNHLHQKAANGSVIDHNKDSRQVASSLNNQNRLKSSMVSDDGAGHKINEQTEEASDLHDAGSASSDMDQKMVVNADGTSQISNDSSNQTAVEHSDSEKKKHHRGEQRADGSFIEENSDSDKKHSNKDATDDRRNEFVHKGLDGRMQHEIKTSNVQNHKNDTDEVVNSSLHAKSANGTEINDVQHSNVSLSDLQESQAAAKNSVLKLADGSTVINKDESHINHGKSRNDAAASHKRNQTNADGSSASLDIGSNSHADLETRGEGGKKERYQDLGNGKVSSLSQGYEKTQAKGGDKSSSHDNSMTSDGKGHFVQSNNASDSHHVIDDKDIVRHKDVIVM
ncbi:hypothetical protein B9Z55_027424 [Caenorhabditis nigoni]|uniref:Uncharacterized protein n=1 Tax=Caenorhabditis nigoni TaxID=1611254 RepID=A0A2G5SG12_9PELO|nr:hypothetical protein B9Z55_027424 [Caenorhabditis nigoni]